MSELLEDDDFQQLITDRLEEDPTFWTGSGKRRTVITVEVEDGHVTLNGVVRTRMDRRRADILVRALGAMGVDNRLRVLTEDKDDPKRVRRLTCDSTPWDRPMPGPRVILLLAEQLRQLGVHGIQFLLQLRVAFDRVAADLLIAARGHAGEIRDVRLQARLAVAHRLGHQRCGDRVELPGLVRVSACRPLQTGLRLAHAGQRLVHRGDELARPHVVLELLLQIRDRDAIGGDVADRSAP